MHDIIYPHCMKAFKIDDARNADVVKQVAPLGRQISHRCVF
jgi:hypothetical protein